MTGGSELAPIRVMIVDDHPVVRNGLIGMFEGEAGFEVVGDAGDGAEAVRRAGALAPDVILMDLRMPEMDGVTAIAALAAGGSPARVLVLTTYDTDSDVLSAIADLYMRWGKEDLAIVEYERLAKLEPDDITHLVTLGEQYFQKGDKARAMATWKRIIANGKAASFA